MKPLNIVVIGDEVQPSSITVRAIDKEFNEVPLSTISVKGFDWSPSDGFAAAAERAERGQDIEFLPEDWRSALAEANVVVTHFFPVRQQILAAAPNLRLVATLRHGEENVDREAASQRSVSVINNPGREAEAVSDFTVTLILDVLRQLTRSAGALRAQGWSDAFSLASRGRTLAGSTVGLIGYGYVGKKVATKLSGFGCRILVHDPYLTPTEIDAEHVKSASLNEVLSTSDIVSLHLRLSESTRSKIGRDQFALMRPDAYIVNTARAELIDEAALIDALQQGRLAGAGLDVFWSEPLNPDHPLMLLSNVTITPHMAGSAYDTQERSAALLVSRVAAAVAEWR